MSEKLITPLENHEIIGIPPQSYDKLKLSENLAIDGQRVSEGTKLTDLFPNGLIVVLRNGEVMSVEPNTSVVFPPLHSNQSVWRIASKKI